MLTAVKRYFRFFKESMKCNFKSIAEYKSSFLVQTIFMFLNNGFFLLFWYVVIAASGEKAGDITLNKILYIWSVPVISFGVAFFFFGGVRELGRHILEGTLDVYLTQPKNVILNVMCSSMEFAAAGDLIYGIVVGLIATEFNLLRFGFLVILGAMGAVFYICVETILRLLTVFIGNTDNIEHTYINTLMISFASYPSEIYGSGIKFLLYTVIPSAYISFVPIDFITTFNIKYLLWFFGAMIVFVAITAALTKFALKRYESGNSIALRS